MSAPGHPRELDAAAVGLILLLSLFWGANLVAIKIGLADAPPLRLAWMRFVLGGLVVLGWARRSGASLRLVPGEPLPLLALGLLFTVQIGLLNLGTHLTSAGHATVLLNAYPIHIVLLAHFFVPGDRIDVRRLGGLLLAYVGVVVLFARQLVGGGLVTGDLLVSLSAFLLGVRIIVMNRQVQHIDPTKILLAQVAVGVPLFFILSSLVETAPYRLTVPLASSLLYQGVVTAGFNFIANLWLLQRYRPSSLAAFYLTTPVFGVAVAWLLLDEPITPDLALATLLVAAGIGLVNRPRRG